MRQIFLFLIVISSIAIMFGGTFSIPIDAGSMEVPVVIRMSDLLDFIPEDFEPVWSSLKVTFEGKEVPFQIEDVDGNSRISSKDFLVFLAKGEGKIVIADQSIESISYKKAFEITKVDSGWQIKTIDGRLEAFVNDHGLAKITKFGDVEATLLDEIGIARVSGWPESTFYVDGKLGKHYEETSGAFRVVSTKVLEPGPLAAGIIATLESEKFKGLVQELVVHIFKNGDILVDNTFRFENYADMMKVQTMVTRPIAPALEDAVHILPVFRRLVWADQLGITPYEYWLERNAITLVDRIPYIVFPATDPMKPLWWGATYIFASMERWRSNFSPGKKIGIAEILPEIPVVPAVYKKWIDGDTWVYESLEFRDGVFKWIPSEFDVYPATKGAYSLKLENMPNHYKHGDTVRHLRLFTLYSAENVTDAIKLLEKKSESFRKLKIGEKPFKEF
ncbi:hypothetical protein [Thermotoga sp. KOL6]|uniref:hypothetical protein n=1 Tax=Thermotoga sp. KOL6 TaxID=126741 RepID=UPI000C790B1B|nr:hypothetical protein [Thermotoga sp. KOL6]PLV60421.1 hypothetical protein AS005_03870 [Thermotoga sp. KOL6]